MVSVTHQWSRRGSPAARQTTLYTAAHAHNLN